MEQRDAGSWFGAKTVFRHKNLERKPGVQSRCEAGTLWDENEALKIAEEEAESYATGDGTRYLHYVNVFKIRDPIGARAEVFSIMRSLSVPEDEYITRFYDDGTFHTR